MYRAMTKLYYRGVHLALIVYDISDRESFDSLKSWLSDVREKQQISKSGGECIYFVVGNKEDLEDFRRV